MKERQKLDVRKLKISDCIASCECDFCIAYRDYLVLTEIGAKPYKK